MRWDYQLLSLNKRNLKTYLVLFGHVSKPAHACHGHPVNSLCQRWPGNPKFNLRKGQKEQDGMNWRQWLC